MPFTEHQFDRAAIKTLVQERAKALKANRGLSDLQGFALNVIAGRLEKDPRRYRDYGPYWPALKAELAASGRDYGPQDWPLLRAAYRGDTPLDTIVMADEFRSWYLANLFVGSNRFLLDREEGEEWVLEDDDLEGLAR